MEILGDRRANGSDELCPLLDRLLGPRQRRDRGARAATLSEGEAELEELEEVPEPVAPEVQLTLADALAVVDRHLEAADLRVREREDLDLLRQRHRVGRRLEARQRLAAEDPHARLRVEEVASEEHHGRARQDEVPE